MTSETTVASQTYVVRRESPLHAQCEEMGSPQVGSLSTGDIVEALESRQLRDHLTRIRVAGGWTTQITLQGEHVLVLTDGHQPKPDVSAQAVLFARVGVSALRQFQAGATDVQRLVATVKKLHESDGIGDRVLGSICKDTIEAAGRQPADATAPRQSTGKNVTRANVPSTHDNALNADVSRGSAGPTLACVSGVTAAETAPEHAAIPKGGKSATGRVPVSLPAT